MTIGHQSFRHTREIVSFPPSWGEQVDAAGGDAGGRKEGGAATEGDD